MSRDLIYPDFSYILDSLACFPSAKLEHGRTGSFAGQSFVEVRLLGNMSVSHGFSRNADESSRFGVRRLDAALDTVSSRATPD